ncbi:MAG: diacylglycerol kinase family protein [Coriobacteriia bacterium]|nr:diacylglycerol kinase family protein [Coriobacteriia bacterium]
MKESRKKASVASAFKYALEGVVNTIKSELSFRVELIVALLALVTSALLRLEPVEWALIILFIVMVLVLELINSALEAFVDLASPEIHPLAKYAKDATAAAVLVAAIGAAVGGSFLFISAALRIWG